MDLFTSIAILLLATAVTGKPVTCIQSSTAIGRNAHKFNTTTAFTKIDPGNDLSIRDTIYITPELLFVGTWNGDILRCLFKDPSVCELFYSYGSSVVTSTVINGEYLYASLTNGAMLRCDLYQKNSCTTLNKPVYEYFSMNCLAVSAGYIHAGLGNGRMLRCDLDQPEKCKIFNEFQATVTSLGATDEYIYAGLESGQIWRCSMSSENSSRLILTVNQMIQGMSAVDDTVVAVTNSGTAWNCTKGQACLDKNILNSGDIKSMAVFNRSLYVMQDSNILLCNWGTGDSNCKPYDHHEGARSISFAYSTYKMQDRFVNEDKTCLSGTRCPPFMIYYKINERPILEVFVKGGKLYNSQGLLVDTRDADVGHSGRAAIFAMDAGGQILVLKVHNSVLRTSSLFAGHPVAGAGEMVVEGGVIKSIRACSDHYWPTVELNQQVVDALYLKGYTDNIDNLPCCNNNESGQVDVEDYTIMDAVYPTIELSNGTTENLFNPLVSG